MIYLFKVSACLFPIYISSVQTSGDSLLQSSNPRFPKTDYQALDFIKIKILIEWCSIRISLCSGSLKRSPMKKEGGKQGPDQRNLWQL